MKNRIVIIIDEMYFDDQYIVYPDYEFIPCNGIDHFYEVLKILPETLEIAVGVHELNTKTVKSKGIIDANNRLKKDYPNLKFKFYSRSESNSNEDVIPSENIKSYFEENAESCFQKVSDALTIAHCIKDLSISYSKSLDDWRVFSFRKNIGKKTINDILCMIFYNPDRSLDDFGKIQIEVLQPGFSGAKLIKVSYLINSNKRQIIVKISDQKYKLETELELKRRNPTDFQLNSSFVFANEIEVQRYSNWYFLTYPVAGASNTLEQVISEKGMDCLEQGFDSVFSGFNPFINEVYNLEVKENINLWQIDAKTQIKTFLADLGSHDGEAISFINNLKNLVDFGKLNSIGIEESYLAELGNFLMTGRYKGEIVTFIENPLLAKIHGDLHPGNIMVDEDFKSVEFIDFALVSIGDKKEPALNDVALLSVYIDFLLRKNSDFVLNGNLKAIQNWRDEHKDFLLLKKDMVKPYSDFLNLYTKFIGAFSSVFQNVSISNESMFAQFQMSRLHYLIKFINYSNIILEKKLFAIMASIDILDFLYNRKFPTG